MLLLSLLHLKLHCSEENKQHSIHCLRFGLAAVSVSEEDILESQPIKTETLCMIKH